MTSPEVLLLLNAIICAGIAIRVLLFRREGARHRWWGGWLAYVVIVVAASVPGGPSTAITSSLTGPT